SAVVSAHQSIVAEHGVPYIVSGASSSTVSRRTDINTSCMFFHRPNTEDSAAVTTHFIGTVLRDAINEKFNYSNDRPLRLAIVYQDSPYGKGQQQAAGSVIRDEGLNVVIVAEESFKMGESDFRTVLTNVKAAKPDAVFAVTFLNELIPMVQQARRDVGLDTVFLGVEPNDDPDYYKGVGRYGEFSVLQSRFSPYAIPAGPTANATIAFRRNFDRRWGGFPSMMGVATYEAVNIAAAAIEKAGTIDKSRVRDALATIEIPEMIEMMKDGKIRFSPEYRESKFELYIEQLYWNESLGELRPKIVWPDSIKETEFVLPSWYAPGSG
ncbi:MAG: ABC transporter substrate-binding protein, partial [Methanomicrobiales archaeon]|nr:ABC transporter substrate-binding protein [Methanomicrobiales archaeon]